MTRIALDAMGGDRAPGAPIEAAVASLEEGNGDLEILLVGDPERLEAALSERRSRPPGLEIVPASQFIAMDEPPVRAVRSKPDNSIRVGLQLQRDGDADAFVSAGSTGAIMAASVLTLGLVPGVDRPAVGAVLPTSGRPVLAIDVGANVACRPGHLHQFAHLGSIYLTDLDPERGAPRVGLLNVGEEPEKGDDVLVETHRLLREDPDLHFVGNVEGHRVIEGACDVLVCDGLVGNVLLKFYESLAGFVVELVDRALSGRTDPGLERVLRLLDYTEHGGAPLLGVNGVVVISHGSSPPRALRSALGVARRSVEAEVLKDLARDVKALSARSRSD